MLKMSKELKINIITTLIVINTILMIVSLMGFTNKTLGTTLALIFSITTLVLLVVLNKLTTIKDFTK